MLNQMTEEEKEKLIKYSFDDLWKFLWGDNNITKYKNEESASREKFNSLLKGITINNINFSLE